MSGVRVLVGTRKGAFVLTTDGTRERWEVAGPLFAGWEIYHMTGSPADPDRLYASQSSGWFGQVMQRSDDGGRTWEAIPDVKPSGFGFGVAVDPRDGDTAWFAPAIKDERRLPVDGKVVVTRTRDGGKTFDVLCKGLPQEHAYDLVYRHALAADDTGDRLAMGSTTGGLWVSEDQGDRWESLPVRLPPVHAVRFA